MTNSSRKIKFFLDKMKAQVKSTAKSIVEEAKEKGRAALYRVSEFLLSLIHIYLSSLVSEAAMY